jgi:hypothetical protein
VVALDSLLTKGSLRAGATCVLFLAFQLAANVYLGLFLCLLLASYGVAVFLVGRDRWHSLAQLIFGLPVWPGTA